MPPLWQLCSRGQVEEVREALERGENVDRQNPGNLPVLIFVVGGQYSENHIAILKLLLEQQWVEVNLAAFKGETALHKATDCGNVEVVKLLLADQRVDVNCKDFNQFTPLIMASGKSEDFAIFKLLLAEQKGDVNWVAFDPDFGETTALMLASWNSNVKATKLLLDDQRVDVNWMNSKGLSVLHALVCKTKPKVNLKLLELFLAHPRVDVNCKSGPSGLGHLIGQTVLHVAAFANNVEAAKLILAEPRFTSANAQAELEGPAVIVAAIRCHWEVLKELVSHPSIDLDVKDKNGLSLDDLIR